MSLPNDTAVSDESLHASLAAKENDAIGRAVDAYRKYYDSIILNEEYETCMTILREAIAATLLCSPYGQLFVERQSGEDMNEAIRCFKEDCEHDEALDNIRAVRHARLYFYIHLCETRANLSSKK